MRLKSLELSGFKSFAKKAVLNFDRPITGVVGPNGSGKSNVAEAFRFALGEQSMKSLRGKRGEDLIWNGSDVSRANRASVKLVLDNKERVFSSIDFDEVSIERVVHRDGSNEYLLNNTSVRLKDIMELLGNAHIGSSGHQIISQGEADRILSATIRERREMIEDALGLKVYQWKKLESLKKLDHTEENIKQVQSLRREIAPHLKFLKKQVEKVEKAEAMKRELALLFREYFSVEDVYIRGEKKSLEEESRAPEKEIAELDKDLKHAKDTITASKNKDKKSDSVINLENKLSKLRAEKDEVTRELGRIEGELSANNRALEREKEKKQKEGLQTVYIKDVEEVVSKIEGFNAIEDARRLYSEVVNALRQFIFKHKTSSDNVFSKEVEKEISNLVAAKAKLETNLASMNKEEFSIKMEYDDLKKEIEKEKDTNREAEKDVFRIIARQNEIRQVLNNINQRMESLKRREEAYKRDLGEAGMIAGREATNFENSSGISYGNIDLEKQDTKRREIEKIKIRLEDAGLGGSSEVMKEYKETEERDAFLAKEIMDLEKAKEELLKLVEDLNTRIDFEFKNGILKINSEFHKFFTLMFGGGKAELSVVREVKKKKISPLDEISGDIEDINPNETEEQSPEGLEVNVSLPKKRIKGLMMLSGGERALTSIALLFAISQVNPPPFIILDETDAALDEANSKKYGDMIENLSKHSQLILITHNRETMSRSGAIYGITMGSDGASRLLSIAFEEAVKVAK